MSPRPPFTEATSKKTTKQEIFSFPETRRTSAIESELQLTQRFEEEPGHASGVLPGNLPPLTNPRGLTKFPDGWVWTRNSHSAIPLLVPTLHSL
jgi:hypothetical protein